jgi:hypothetical protein
MKTWNNGILRQNSFTCVVLLVLLLSARQVVAELPVQNTISLQGGEYAVDRLAPDVLSETAAFQVVAAQGVCIRVRITTSSDGIATWIVGPNSEHIDEQTIESFGGTYAAFEGAESGSGTFLLPTDALGFHQLYDFPSLGPGVYTMHFEADPGLDGEVAVLTDLSSDSRCPIHFAEMGGEWIGTAQVVPPPFASRRTGHTCTLGFCVSPDPPFPPWKGGDGRGFPLRDFGERFKAYHSSSQSR